LAGLSLVWQLAQSVALAAAWVNVACFQSLVLWQEEHWPGKWLAGLSLEWQLAQSVALATEWLNVACFQSLVLWQAEH
jgi:hypothetical protein